MVQNLVPIEMNDEIHQRGSRTSVHRHVAWGLHVIAGPECAGGRVFRRMASAEHSRCVWRRQPDASAGVVPDVAGNLNRSLAVVGEVSGNYKDFDETTTVGGITATVKASMNVHTFLGGVRFNARQNPSFTPFVQALFGLARVGGDAERSRPRSPAAPFPSASRCQTATSRLTRAAA